MPITRTPIIDDDGSGTTGTVFENAWKQELYNQIDALTVAVPAPYRITARQSFTLAAAAINDVAFSGQDQAVVWLWASTSPSGTDITGIVAEPDGTRHLIINNGGQPIRMQTDHGGSAALNRIIGPGYSLYTLGVWRAAWISYLANYGRWFIEAP